MPGEREQTGDGVHRITLEIGDLSEAVFAEYCVQIADETLRADMVANERLSSRLMKYVLDRAGAKSEVKIGAPLDAADISWVLREDRTQLLRKLGIAAFANRFAGIAVSGEMAKKFPDIEQSELTWSLKFRGKAPESVLETASVEDEGNACLDAWIQGFEKDVAWILRRKLERRSTADKDEKRRLLATSVIRDLRSEEARE